MNRHVELLWSSDCPNHPVARQMLAAAIERVAPGISIDEIDAFDPEVAASVASSVRRRSASTGSTSSQDSCTPVTTRRVVDGLATGLTLRARLDQSLRGT
jgi:hypothetical protein